MRLFSKYAIVAAVACLLALPGCNSSNKAIKTVTFTSDDSSEYADLSINVELPASNKGAAGARMVGDRVTVRLNGILVVDNVSLENYWDRQRPIFPIEQIELQAHGSKVYYRDIYIKRLN